MNQCSVGGRANRLIPGGAHTYSRGFDQFPSNAPEFLTHGSGSWVKGSDGRTFLDFGMGLRSVTLGYAESRVNAAAIRGLTAGNNLTKTTGLELELAEKMINFIDSFEMVKFCKNGSNANSSAIKLARAHTGKTKIAKCAQNPFLSFDDWFISDTPMNRGIPKHYRDDILNFEFNDRQGFLSLFEQYSDDLACVIMEPIASPAYCPVDENCACFDSNSSKPVVCNRSGEYHFLRFVRELCNENNVVLIFDEVVTGLRLANQGGQEFFGVKPDLSTFGKALGNGFSVACVGGSAEIMELGGIVEKGAQRTFLLSSTYGSELCSLSACIAVLDIYEKERIVEKLWSVGSLICNAFRKGIAKYALSDVLSIEGPVVNPRLVCGDLTSRSSPEMLTLMAYQLMEHGVMMPWIAVSNSFGPKELAWFEDALDDVLMKYKRGVEDRDFRRSSMGDHLIKPVFRAFN